MWYTSAPASAPVERSCTRNVTSWRAVPRSTLVVPIIRPGTVAVLTVTGKDPVAVLPLVSVAEQETVVVPIGNVLPEAGAQVTGRGPSTRSDAVAADVTIAPAGEVAVAATPAGSVRVGGVRSTTVIVTGAVLEALRSLADTANVYDALACAPDGVQVNVPVAGSIAAPAGGPTSANVT